MKSFRQFITELSADAVKAKRAAMVSGQPENKKEDEERDDDTADETIAFGRFNPPTTGHEKLLNRVKRAAGKGEYHIYPSRSMDSKKNPLDPDEKIEYMRKMFPKYAERIMNEPDSKTIFDVLKKVNASGARSINIVVGADRQREFENLANKYNHDLYDFDRINVISAGERDAESEGVEGMSASKLRAAAAKGDYNTFRGGVPKTLDDENAQKLYNTIRKGMRVKESVDMWRIAPKFHWKNLRENYVNGNIFKVDDIVENDNSGLIGKILRRGANYIIAVTEDNIMFKSWIKDISEWTNVSGVPSDQRLIGTDAHLKYVQSISHPQAYKTVAIKKFINKFRKKRSQNV